MITAEEARQLTGKVLEEMYELELDVIAEHIVKACKEGRSSVRILNANKLFPNREYYDDVRFVLK